MKKNPLFLMASVACGLLTACTGPFGTLGGRIFPDGSSGYLEDASLTVNGVSGTLSAKKIYFSGTNGFPMVLTTNIPPAGTGVLQR